MTWKDDAAPIAYNGWLAGVGLAFVMALLGGYGLPNFEWVDQVTPVAATTR